MRNNKNQNIDKNVTSFYLTKTRNCQNEINVYINLLKILLQIFFLFE